MVCVLVVDDSASMRSYVRSALEQDEPTLITGNSRDESALADSEPIQVVEASSGFDALRLLPRGNFDLVIADVNMPDINGIELIRFLRESPRHREVPIVIISTQRSEKSIERALATGANGFLAKPFTADALRKEVAAQLARVRGEANAG